MVKKCSTLVYPVYQEPYAVIPNAVVRIGATRNAVIPNAEDLNVVLRNAVLNVAASQVPLLVARAFSRVRSRYFPVVDHVVPIRLVVPVAARGLAVDEAQGALLRRLVEFPCWSQEPLRAPAARARGKLWSASVRRPTEFREHVQQHPFAAPERRPSDLYPTFHGAVDRRHHVPDPDLLSCVRSVLQLPVLFAPDFQNPGAAVVSRHAVHRNHVDHPVDPCPYPDRDLDNDRHDDSDANADPSGSTTTDTSKRRCRMRS